MKIEVNSNDKHKIEVSSAINQEIGDKKTNIRLVKPNMEPGHRLYECNMLDRTVDAVKFKASIHFKTKQVTETYMRKDGCEYIPATSEDNAFKKLAKAYKTHIGVNFRLAE